MSETEQKPATLTVTQEQLEQLVDSRVKRALREKRAPLAKSPAPRKKVLYGRAATSAGFFDSLSEEGWSEIGRRFDKLTEEKREQVLKSLRKHRQSIGPTDPTGRRLDRLIAELEER